MGTWRSEAATFSSHLMAVLPLVDGALSKVCVLERLPHKNYTPVGTLAGFLPHDLTYISNLGYVLSTCLRNALGKMHELNWACTYIAYTIVIQI